MKKNDPLNMVANAVKNSVLNGTANKASPPPQAPSEPSPPAFKVSEGKQAFSNLFRLANAKRDHDVTVFKEKHWSESIRDLIPEVNPNYVWQPEIEAFHVAIESGEPILITGPTGCGKSTMVEQYGAVTQRPFVRINMRGDIETSSLLGMQQAKNGQTYWTDGSLTQAVKEGGIALIDEYDFTPPEIMYSIQWLLEDNPKLLLTDKSDKVIDMMVKAHPNFRFVFAGNTKGQGDMTGEFPGAQVQSMATVDRCKTTLHMGYLPEVQERAIIKGSVPSITSDMLDKIMQLVGILRTSYSQGHLSVGVSPRTEVSFAEKWLYWNDPKYAFDLSFGNKLEETERKPANDIFHRVFGSV